MHGDKHTSLSGIRTQSIIRNDEMLNQVQHDNAGEFSVTLNLFQGLMNTDTSVFDYGLWTVLPF